MSVKFNDVFSFKISLLTVAICFLFAIEVYNLYFTDTQEKKIDKLNGEIKKLNQEVSNIYRSYDSVGFKIDGFKKEIKDIEILIESNNRKIDNLKKYEQDQKNSFKSYDARMWEQYFTDRYKKRTK